MRLTKLKLCLSALAAVTTMSLQATEFYVAPTGQASATGSMSNPWDLQTALNQPSSVKPGDTIWLRGGTHRINNHITKFTSRLTGTSTAPIIVRQYPGERAIVDGNILQNTGGYVNYWGFEILNSNTDRLSSETGPWPTDWVFTYDGKSSDYCVSGFDLQAPNVKLINLIIHDSIGGGIGVNSPAQNAEIYGVLSYYNGWQAPDRAHGHGIYGQNAAPYTKQVKESLFFGNLASGFQVTGTGPTPGVADNFQVEGCAVFMNGSLANAHQANFLLGAYQGQAQNPSMIRNFIYDTKAGALSADANIGYTGGSANAVVRDNIFGTSVTFAPGSNMSVSGNTFATSVTGLDKTKFSNNTFAKPTANVISVRPNQYESGRANIVIYNYQKLSSVSVNVAGIGLNSGDQYELHNAQNFYGDVITGTYTGSPISIPTSGRTVAKPVGSNFATPASTFPDFGVFVIMKKPGSTTTPPATNSAPTVSSIAAQTVNQNTATTAIPFTIGDKETAATSLTLTASSSNTTLVPNANIVLGGSGANRTVTVAPAANQSGTTTISIKVSDGTNTSTATFGLTVAAAVNTKPTISTITAQTVVAGATTSPIAFTVNDTETLAANLTLAATSSNTSLVPNANIILGGSGNNRTVAVKSITNQTGVATITLTVNDGSLTSSTSFGLTITPSTSGGGTNTTTNVTDKVYLAVEAESGTLTAPMTIVTNAQSETQRSVWTTTANQGSVSYTVDIAKAGTYYLIAKALVPTYANDSFFVSVDGQEDVFDAGENRNAPDWQWIPLNGRNGGAPLTLNPRTLNLTQGKHTILIRGREVQAALDRFVLTTDKDFVPSKTVAANADTVTAFPGQANLIPAVDLLRNDVALFPDDMTIKSVGAAQNGTVVLSGTDVSYTPKTGFTGADTFTYTVINSDGGSSTGTVTVNVQVPATVHLGLEAEAGVLTAPMTIGSDAQVATRKYLSSATANSGTATYSVDIPKTDTYIIWCKVLGSSYASDSFFVSVDGKEDIYDATEGMNSPKWQWTKVNGRNGGGVPLALNPRTFNLTQGKHTIVIRGREVSAGIDRIVITSDADYTPEDVTVMPDTVTASANVTKQIVAADLLKNDIALFDDALTITAISAAQNGTAVLSNGSISYTPKAGFVGTDTFTYTVTDGQGGTATGTVTIKVQSSALAQPTS